MVYIPLFKPQKGVATMFIEVVKKVQGVKTYKTILIRESYRDKGKVKHRTICNISKLPAKHIQQIKKVLAGERGDFNIEDLKTGRTYEYGASYVFCQFAEKIGLDKMIFSQKVQWREDVMSMIIGRLLYQGSKLSLVNMFADTALWELAGYKFGERPNVEKTCYRAMDELLARKNKIQKKLVKKHLQDGCLLLYDITNLWLEGEYKHSEYVTYGKSKDRKRGYKQIAVGLLTDKNGCPVAVEVFKGSMSDQKTVYDQVKKISSYYEIKDIVFVGDRGMLTQKRIDEVNSENFKTITALTHTQIESLIQEGSMQPDLFDEKNIIEVHDLNDKNIRYMLCKNPETMREENATRKSLIDAVSRKLAEKANVKKKRDKSKVSASIGRIFEKYKIEKFFEWEVDEEGRITWFLKQDKILKEEVLDGCYAIRTDVCSMMNKNDIVQGYRNLQKVEFAFKNLKTVLLEMRPMYHKTDNRLISHIFLTMLAYYIQWHATEKLEPLFEADGKGTEKRWTIETVIERLKSIRKVENTIDGIVVKTDISTPDEEQKQIINLLGVELK
jgi:transposase